MQIIMWSSALRVTLLGSLLLLSGCATLTKEQCIVGNWQAIGYNDGVAGHYADRLTEHNKACAKVGVAPDYQAWERGRQQGLTQYCTVSNAYNIGERGRELNSVCPANMISKLQQANTQGLEHYKLTSKIKDQEKQLEKYTEEYNKLRNGELLEFKSEKEARTRLLSLHSEIQHTKRHITDAQLHLKLLKQNSVYQ